MKRSHALGTLGLGAVLTLAACSGGGSGGGDAGPSFGLNERVVVTDVDVSTGVASPTLADAPAAFADLELHSVQVVDAGDGGGRLFSVDLAGVVHVFDDAPATNSSSVFLDITDRVTQNGGEEGLFSLAFDPAYVVNGWFYVHYVADAPRRTVISRFDVTIDPLVADPTSEFVLLEFERPSEFHCGGALAFGPDGMLYATSGDGVQPHLARDISSLFGKVLRIAPDGSIPLDNPFVGAPGARGEVYALGFRNPWRISFDSLTSELWLADAGQDEVEEVDVIVAGGDYGWPVYEGDRENDNPFNLPPTDFEEPVHVYSSHGGGSITGGRVYRGTQIPSLVGRFVFADMFGDVHALEWNGVAVVSDTLVARGLPFPVSIDEDADAELLISCLGDERIHRLVEHLTAPAASAMPLLLSDTGVFSDLATLTPSPGVIEFDVNSPLWSDGAHKRRFIALPGEEDVVFDAQEAWTFPLGTVLVKHFDVPLPGGATRRMETRLFVHDDEGWQGYSYRWNPGETDADLLDGAAFEYMQVDDGSGGAAWRSYYFPSRSECLDCHSAAAGHVLGVRTAQLNRDFDYAALTDNQLRAWNHIGLFTTDIGAAETHAALADPSDATADLGERARAYMQANCAHCHTPGGSTGVDMDLRAHAPTMNIVDVLPTSGHLWIANSRRVASGVKESSVLWVRMQQLNGLRMPMLASNAVDPLGVAVIGAWIDAGAP